MDERERGLEAYERRAWGDAYEALASAEPLAAADLERLATSAYMVGRDEEHVAALERAHHAHLDAGDLLPAARCAFWVGISLLLGGEPARGTGWLGRAQRLVDRHGSECVEQGYLMLAAAKRHEVAGEWHEAAATAAGTAAIAERFGDPDLLGLALQEQGRVVIRMGRATEGLALLDEAMVGVIGGEVSPIVTGLLYCSMIDGCHEVYALRRAAEWTTALTRWCEEQPDMVAFTGRCLMHRAELLELHGDWRDALAEAHRAARRQGMGARGQAHYREGEVHRLRGERAAAEAAYREASRHGYEPQPGLALLRFAQGHRAAAEAAIRRAVGEASEPVTRAALLPAYVEILLAGGDLDAARAACRELATVAAGFEGGALDAHVAYAEGAIALAADDAVAALGPLRRAGQVWQELDAPYETARVRVLVAVACRALGDDETATLELEAARRAFERLGAAPDVARVEALTGTAAHGLTPRELQVLRLVAAGRTNKQIAAELVLSERTVDRHVSNMLTKLGVPSRAAATAFAYEHRLM